MFIQDGWPWNKCLGHQKLHGRHLNYRIPSHPLHDIPQRDWGIEFLMNKQDVLRSTVPLTLPSSFSQTQPRREWKAKDLGGRILRAHQVPFPHLMERAHEAQRNEDDNSMSPSKWVSVIKLRENWVSKFLPQVTRESSDICVDIILYYGVEGREE